MSADSNYSKAGDYNDELHFPKLREIARMGNLQGLRNYIATHQKDAVTKWRGLQNDVFDVNKPFSSGETILHAYANLGFAAGINLLIEEFGANPNIRLKLIGPLTEDQLTASEYDPAIGATPILFATNIATAQCLLKHGVNINAVSDAGLTPLHYSIIKAAKKADPFRTNTPVELVKFLADNGSDLTKRTKKEVLIDGMHGDPILIEPNPRIIIRADSGILDIISVLETCRNADQDKVKELRSFFERKLNPAKVEAKADVKAGMPDPQNQVPKAQTLANGNANAAAAAEDQKMPSAPGGPGGNLVRPKTPQQKLTTLQQWQEMTAALQAMHGEGEGAEDVNTHSHTIRQLYESFQKLKLVGKQEQQPGQHRAS